MDAVGGILVGIYILTESYVALRGSSLVHLERSTSLNSLEIESMIEMNSQIKEMKELKLRRAGPFIVGIFEVVVDGGMTVKQIHTVVTELENSIRKRIPGLRSLTVKAIPSS